MVTAPLGPALLEVDSGMPMVAYARLHIKDSFVRPS
jgi:hypothetical protein